MKLIVIGNKVTQFTAVNVVTHAKTSAFPFIFELSPDFQSFLLSGQTNIFNYFGNIIVQKKDRCLLH